MCIYWIFQFSEIIFFSFSCITHNKTKILGGKNTVRVPSRMKLTKNPVFLHYFSKFMGILLFVLKYMFISLFLKIINGYSWSANIMASPFNNACWDVPQARRHNWPHFKFDTRGFYISSSYFELVQFPNTTLGVPEPERMSTKSQLLPGYLRGRWIQFD